MSLNALPSWPSSSRAAIGARALNDAPHGDGEDGAGGHDGEDADGELTVPVPRDFREHGLHRAGDAHDGAHLVIAAVAALALLLVADRREQGEVPRAVA